ncbi:hypothetical protein BGZ81_010329 [Podila clonocystis]|nr:hypothetical protein BGZ81_010329 [Podila clonocystis]
MNPCGNDVCTCGAGCGCGAGCQCGKTAAPAQAACNCKGGDKCTCAGSCDCSKKPGCGCNSGHKNHSLQGKELIEKTTTDINTAKMEKEEEFDPFFLGNKL